MASYKVIQDIEAEDKLLGPLTLRQFIYAFVGGCLVFLSYFVAARGAAYLIVLFVPPALLCAFFAFPWSHEQTTEVWALARIRFLLKPRRRIWDQSGIKELVTITAPKRLAEVYTDGLSQTEVHSRLKALANTIDSRGWAVKNATNPYMYTRGAANDDRLVAMGSLPQQVPTIGAEKYVDMLDTGTNTVARQLDTMLTKKARSHRQQLISSLQSPPQQQTQQQPQQPFPQPPPAQDDPTAYSPPSPSPSPLLGSLPSPQQPPAQTPWFVGQSTADDTSVLLGQNVGAPIAPPMSPTQDEDRLVEELRKRAPGPALEYSHLPTIQPLSQPAAAPPRAGGTPQATAARLDQPGSASHPSGMTQPPDPAILALAGNDDLSVATIAREAEKRQDSDEVVISLR